MLTSKVRSLAFILGATVCMWSCGDDDDSTGATGGKSAGGNAGKGGAAMTGGGTSKGGTTNTSGGATNKGGGTSTTGGKTNGGSTGMAGGGAGGAGEGGGGAGPVAGAGAGGAMGGAGAGGVVGQGGEMSGGAGAGGAGAGAGGEGGEAALTLSQACTIACAHVPTNCPTVDEDNSCAARCTSMYDASKSPSVDPDEPKKSADIARLNQEYVDMLRCLATKVTANNGYVCRADGNESPIAAWSAAPATACETEVCTWTLDDAFYADLDVFDRCSQ